MLCAKKTNIPGKKLTTLMCDYIIVVVVYLGTMSLEATTDTMKSFVFSANE